MSYSPNNPQVFASALAGALSALGVRPNGPGLNTDYVQQAAAALAVAEAIDTAWGVNPNNAMDYVAVGVSAGLLMRSSNTFPVKTVYTQAANWAKAARAIVASIKAGDIAAEDAGITLPDVGGGGVTWASLRTTMAGGGVPNFLPLNTNAWITYGQGDDSNTVLNGAIRFRNESPQNLMVVRNASDDGDMVLMSNQGGTFYLGDPTGAWAAFQEWVSDFVLVNITNDSSNTNGPTRWGVSGPSGPGAVFTVYSDTWSYSTQHSEQFEDPEQTRLGFGATGPTGSGTGPVVVQVPVPNHACIVAITVDLQAWEPTTPDGGWWRIEQTFFVAPGPVITAIGTPTVTTLGTSAAAASVNPTFTVLGDGFVSVSVTPWSLLVDIGWQGRQRIRVVDNGDFTFALAPAPEFGLV